MTCALLRQLRETETATLPLKSNVERRFAGPRYDGVRLPMTELRAIINRRRTLIDPYPVGNMRTLVFTAVPLAVSFTMATWQIADQLRGVSVYPLVDRFMTDRDGSATMQPT